nr:PREDICTED: DNA-directed RNA polymerase, mitochondrial-like [Anolis carolinensis]|eukprot:XP_008123619.2 PREDICTED: DNA-directed RNA polymerase, mitochondrial-like [Anolis carolinensis]
MSVLKLQGALFWRAESLWIGLRKYSSAKVKEEARKRWVLEQAELLEVLEARVKQLQTEVGMDTVPFSRVEKSSFFQPVPPWKALSPTRTESTATSGEQGSPQPSRWMEKLNKEKSIKHKRLLRLEAKLARVSSNPGVKPIKPTSKRTQGPEDQLEQLRNAGRKAKLQPLESGRGLRGRKKAAVMSTEELEKGLPDPPLPLEEDNGHQLGNLQLSILSYMDTCLFLRQPEKALQCLAFYHRSHARRKLLDVRMYNLVLHEYAKKVRFPLDRSPTGLPCLPETNAPLLGLSDRAKN